MDLRGYMQEVIVQGLSDYHESLLASDADRARDSGEAMVRSEGAYGLAFGVFGDMEASPIRGDERVWDSVVRRLELVCAQQEATGAAEKSKAFHPGAVFSWLRSVQDYGEHIDLALRERIERTLRPALEGYANQIPQYMEDGTRRTSGNLWMYWMLNVWLGGQIYDIPEWEASGRETLERAIGLQFSDGYWPDSFPYRGPIIRYNTVAISRVAAYALASGRQPAVEALERAAAFHRYCSYPNGACIATFDERSRGVGTAPNPKLMWSLAPFESTRAHAAYFAERLRAKYGTQVPQQPAPPLLVDAWRHTPEGEVEPIETVDFEHVLPTVPALVARRPPWYVCLSAAATSHAPRFCHHDLQSHLSLWHDRVGVISGGGNSMYDPLFSTFLFHGLYLAAEGNVEASNGAAEVRLNYGPIRAFLQVSFLDDQTVQLDARAEGDLPQDSQFALHFPQLAGDRFAFDDYERTLDEEGYFTSLSADIRTCRVGPFAIESSNLLVFAWPLAPASAYGPQTRQPGLNNAIFRMGADLAAGPARITVRVTK